MVYQQARKWLTIGKFEGFSYKLVKKGLDSPFLLCYNRLCVKKHVGG